MIFWQLLLVVFVLGIFQHFVFQVTRQNVVCVGNYVPVRRPCRWPQARSLAGLLGRLGRRLSGDVARLGVAVG